MANVIDYLRWRGDVPWEVDSLNEIDILILSRFSYLPFQTIKMKKVDTIGNISKQFVDYDIKKFVMPGDKALAVNLVNSKRFKDIKVTDYQVNTDLVVQKQFLAVTLHLPDGEKFISYCGTDDTLVGWKEDFNMSFMMHVPAQLESVDYLKRIMKEYPKAKFNLAGHSKGGNLAVYSATYAGKTNQKRIKKIINHDGPGFDKKIIKLEEYQNIKDKIRTYVPQSSIVGLLLEHDEEFKIVKSEEKGIMQHDIFSWQVLGTKIIQLKELTNGSKMLDRTLKTWLKKTTGNQRKEAVDAIYALIETTNTLTTKEFGAAKFSNFATIIKSYTALNNEDKQMIKAVVKALVDATSENLGKKFEDD